MSDTFNNVRRFLQAARAATAMETNAAYKRRVPLHPYARLQATTALRRILSGPGDESDEITTTRTCAFNLPAISGGTCSELTILSGLAGCNPPWLNIEPAVPWTLTDIRYEGITDFECGSVSSTIGDMHFDLANVAGVWAAGTDSAHSIAASVSTLGVVSLYKDGVLLDSVGGISYTDGLALRLKLDPDAGRALVFYNNVGVLSVATTWSPGRCGVWSNVLFAIQSLSIFDCRCG